MSRRPARLDKASESVRTVIAPSKGSKTTERVLSGAEPPIPVSELVKS